MKFTDLPQYQRHLIETWCHNSSRLFAEARALNSDRAHDDLHSLARKLQAWKYHQRIMAATALIDDTGELDDSIAEYCDANNLTPCSLSEIDLSTLAPDPAPLAALQAIAGWSKCQCTTAHGDNPNCPVLVAESAIAKATNSEPAPR